MTRQKKLLMWTVLIVSLVQTTGVAVNPIISQMKDVVFPEQPLATIQTVMALTGLVGPFVALLAAEIVRRGLITKKAIVVTGLFAMGTDGILSAYLHHDLWQIGALNCLMGFSGGCFISTMLSIMMDNYGADDRRKITGRQSIFINIGGLLNGIIGGMLTAWTWYGGYLVMLLAIPIGIFALFSIPKETRLRRTAVKENRIKPKAKFDRIIFLYTAILIVFSILLATMGSNIAVHLASSGFPDPALVGVVSAYQGVGGIAIGFFLARATKKFGDRLIVAAFALLFVSYSMLNLFHASLPLVCTAVFIMGAAVNIIGPYCIIAVGHCVDVSTSAFASSLVTGIAPGLGSFLSPVLLTNFTNALVRDSTNFRFQFVALISLVCAIIVMIVLLVRSRRAPRGMTEESVRASR